MSKGKINFNAGPAAMPPEVLHEVSKSVWNFKNTGVSILELPHRSPEFLDIIEESKSLVKELCDLGSDYEVMWVHGGGRIQFAMLPMNFLRPNGSAGYIDSGHWASEAIDYAKSYGKVNVLSSSRASNYDRLPGWPAKIPQDLSYLHITTNNTIFGTQYHSVPKVNCPLVGDMSSDILSCKRDYTKYALFYAAAQKNLGTPGIALVVVRKDFLKNSSDTTPPILSYKGYAKENSVVNTANVSGIYISLLMLRWIRLKGIANIEKDNNTKARILYERLDASNIFTPHVENPAHRSNMNVCFTARNNKTEIGFLRACEENNIVGITGHRSVGGFRISLYNSTTVEAVETLVELMKNFEAKA